MKIGVALPATVADVTGPQLVAWARSAEEHGFASLAVLDRLVYSNVEPLIALAAAAAVTDRIELATTILIGPFRANAALLAKQLASIDLISGGLLDHGGGDAAAFAKGAADLAAAWKEAGREGEPRTSALAYFALGPSGPDNARAYLADYYGFLGAGTAQAIAAGAVTDPEAVRTRVRDFAAAGCGELAFVPCDKDPGQVGLLADALAAG
ncbi:MAG: LLM class flavin-dependent oxidoreductase [Lapillicoccus sp.]